MNTSKTKVYVQTLGCPKNMIRTQDFYKALDYEKNEVVYSPEDADIIIVNTCGFIADAVKESIVTSLELKQQYPEKKLIFAGCVPLRFGIDTVKNELKEVDDVFAGMNTQSNSISNLAELGPVLTFPYAYVSISEGCNGTCTYCTIPKFWGKLKSRPLKDILGEINSLSELGIKEVVLVSQDSGAWGTDIYGKPSLRLLIDALKDTDVPWKRIMYLNPTFVNEKLLYSWESANILPYFDIPLQSGSTRILNLMKRGYDRDKAVAAIKLIDQFFARSVKRTSLIAGFPTEEDEDIELTIDLIKSCGFNHVGVFAYSDEDEAESSSLSPKIDRKTISQRKRKLELVALELQKEWEKRLISTTQMCLVEASTEGEFVGRVWGQAPEVDGVFVGKGDVEPGEMVEVVVEQAKPGKLFGHKKGEKDTQS